MEDRKFIPGEFNEFGGVTAEGYPDPIEREPHLEDFEAWTNDSICEATDGCTVEPDGECEHGYPSWLLYAGLV